MSKFVAEVLQLNDNSLYPRLYCLGADGFENVATTLTLCDAVWELRGAPLQELTNMLNEVAANVYISQASDLADMSVNDKLIWVRPPVAPLGSICISNENIPELSVDEGPPQSFTVQQFSLVSKLATEFQSEIMRHGTENLVGVKFEVNFS